MVGFVKDFNTFETLRTVRPISWDVAIESVDNEQSVITAPIEDVSDTDAGRWLILGEALLLIQDVHIGSESAVLRCGNLLKAFDRTVRLEDVPGAPWDDMTTFIMDLLGGLFADQADEKFAMPYLSISGTSSVAYVPPETDELGCFSVFEFLTDLKVSHGIRLTWQTIGCAGLGLSVELVHSSAWTGGQIVLGAGRDQLIEAPTFASAEVAKVTVLQPSTNEDGVETVNATDYYLFSDGSFSTDASAGVRASGSWKTVIVSEKAEAEEISEKVASTFQRGIDAASIRFRSAKDLSVGAPINLRVKKTKYSGYITYKGFDSSDRRFVYRCGNKPVTLTEQIRKLAAQKVSKSSQSASSSGSGDGERNVIIGVQQNGVDLPVSSARKVNITVPTKLGDLENDVGYLKDADAFDLRTTDDGRGNLRLFKADGTLAVNAYANSGSGGEIDICDAAGSAKAELWVGNDGAGYLALKDADGNKSTLSKKLIDKIGSGGDITGNAATATKLKTARTIRTNLASTSAASFDGSANITPGVTGTLPIANGGTGATSAANALSMLGGISIKKLWENASPTSSFAAQTISLNLTGYSGILLLVRSYASEQTNSSIYIPIGRTGRITAGWGYSTNSFPVGGRTFVVSNSGVSVGSGYFNQTQDDEMAIPDLILAVKGVGT